MLFLDIFLSFCEFGFKYLHIFARFTQKKKEKQTIYGASRAIYSNVSGI